MKTVDLCNCSELSLNDYLTINGGQQVNETQGIELEHFTWDKEKTFAYNIGAAIGYAFGKFMHDVVIPFYNANSPVYTG